MGWGRGRGTSSLRFWDFDLVVISLSSPFSLHTCTQPLLHTHVHSSVPHRRRSVERVEEGHWFNRCLVWQQWKHRDVIPSRTEESSWFMSPRALCDKEAASSLQPRAITGLLYVPRALALPNLHSNSQKAVCLLPNRRQFLGHSVYHLYH